MGFWGLLFGIPSLGSSDFFLTIESPVNNTEVNNLAADGEFTIVLDEPIESGEWMRFFYRTNASITEGVRFEAFFDEITLRQYPSAALITNGSYSLPSGNFESGDVFRVVYTADSHQVYYNGAQVIDCTHAVHQTNEVGRYQDNSGGTIYAGTLTYLSTDKINQV